MVFYAAAGYCKCIAGRMQIEEKGGAAGAVSNPSSPLSNSFLDYPLLQGYMRITGTGGYPLLLKLLPLSVGGNQYIVLSDETDKKRGGNHEH
jgi:hypothetical protein